MVPGDRRWHLLAAAHVLALLGVLLQLGGGSWDVASHILKVPEAFWTPPHVVLYTGVGLTGVAALMAPFLRWTAKPPIPRTLTSGLLLVLAATGAEAFAGGFDNWWHENIGFDPVLFSPPHAILISAMALNALGVALGSLRLAASPVASLRPWAPWVRPMPIPALGCLWISLNALLYLYSDLGGFEFTFRLEADALAPYRMTVTGLVILGLGATGTLVLLTARRVLPWRLGPAAVAATVATMMTAAVLVPLRGAEDSVPLHFIPLYLSMLIPITLLSLWPRGDGGFRGPLRAAALAPFAFALDGWYSSSILPAILDNPAGLATVAVLLAAVMGLMTLRFSRRFAALLRGTAPRRAEASNGGTPTDP
jgi:hypothetical protein